MRVSIYKIEMERDRNVRERLNKLTYMNDKHKVLALLLGGVRHRSKLVLKHAHRLFVRELGSEVSNQSDINYTHAEGCERDKERYI